uniref:ABC transporter ATP-binding protein n=1 Tax=Nonomuraea lactucae TaxID=2249762 RepID=UPI0013B42811
MNAKAAETTKAAGTVQATAPAEPVLAVEGLTLDLTGGHAQPRLVEDVTFTVPRGGSVALIGESGCGKTMTAMAVLGLLPAGVRPVAGSVRLGERELLRRGERELASVRGREIGTIFQEPMTSLNPTMTVGDQIAESRRLHLGERRGAARRRAQELLDRVGIADAGRRVDCYPHELSGGMQQRVMIAAAVACEPRLLIADEPTTALDVTIQAEILDLLDGLRRDLDMAVLLVTHDLGVVADFCEDVVVMYAGHVVERAPAATVFDAARHPYTRALLRSVPADARPRTRLAVIPGRVPP